MQLLHLYSQANIKQYTKYLKTISALSNLYSESSTPYLPYRIVENIFCKSFGGKNLSRSDISYDAQIANVCFGIKTFVDNSPWQKIAEFNRYSEDINSHNNIYTLVHMLSSLRNERIQFANRLCSAQQAFYHCVTRDKNVLYIFEEEYIPIQLNLIRNIYQTRAGIGFSDSVHEYRYNFSKSTLYKKFNRVNTGVAIPIQILDNPIDILVELLDSFLHGETTTSQQNFDYVILPLYSTRNARVKYVPEKSGLNQWNAGGRARDYGEVYIPVPAEIHSKFPGFFPPRNEMWTLITPNGRELSAKICQDGGKAIMTNPNNALCDWLLRGTLALREGELLGYEHLRKIGVDSVKITKFSRGSFAIDFTAIDSYENFIEDARN